ncbi:MAG TPA: hypothetical protein VFX67_02215 [Burkholderiales bacterium]|nr:hypothetical protein [Burkholderiales bacterium]
MKAKRAIAVALAVVTIGAVAVVADALFFLRPVAAEAGWRTALAIPVPALQRQAIRALRKHATRAAAIALVEFINERSRAGDLELAVGATETLCVLSGRSFNSWFTNCSAGRDWAKHAGDAWPDVLERINAWRTAAFGKAS